MDGAAFAFAIFVIAPLIGLIPASIAKSKGRSFLVWWLFGWALWIVALPAAIIVGPGGSKRRCPSCDEPISVAAKVCPHCQREVSAFAMTLPPQQSGSTKQVPKSCQSCGQPYFSSTSVCLACEARVRAG
jgi:hypothetical protein